MIPLVWMLTTAPLHAIPAPLWLLLVCTMAVALCSTIPLQLNLDTRRAWADEAATWHGPGLTDLPRRVPVIPTVDEQIGRPPTELIERVLDGLRRWDGPRHASNVVAETPLAYTPLHLRSVGEVAEEFQRIVAAEFGVQRCDSCTVGFDPEPAHASCPGCSCPCTTVDALPDGVAGYAIAGATR